jgi:hypothetical protein
MDWPRARAAAAKRRVLESDRRPEQAGRLPSARSIDCRCAASCRRQYQAPAEHAQADGDRAVARDHCPPPSARRSSSGAALRVAPDHEEGRLDAQSPSVSRMAAVASAEGPSSKVSATHGRVLGPRNTTGASSELRGGTRRRRQRHTGGEGSERQGQLTAASASSGLCAGGTALAEVVLEDGGAFRRLDREQGLRRGRRSPPATRWRWRHDRPADRRNRSPAGGRLPLRSPVRSWPRPA